MVFMSGVLVGSVLTGFHMKHRMGRLLHDGTPAVRDVIMKKLTAELDLTNEQQGGIGQIVGETQLKLQQLRAQYRPQMEEIISSGIARMKPILSAEQQKKLDAFYAKMQKRWRMRRGL